MTLTFHNHYKNESFIFMARLHFEHDIYSNRINIINNVIIL